MFLEIKVLEYLHLTVLHVFFIYKHIKIRELGSDMLKVTQDIG